MKIAIISDTHDNVANLKKVVSFIKKEKIKILIHCGDIFKPETLKEGLKGYQGKVYIIFSKADASFSKIPEDSFENFPRMKVYESFGEMKKDGKKIAFCHFPEIAEKLAKSQSGKRYHLIFYGHTHKPWIKTIGKTKLVNPGNVAGLFYKATFAIYDTKKDKLELKII
jgi:putative phosphoesterase